MLMFPSLEGEAEADQDWQCILSALQKAQKVWSSGVSIFLFDALSEIGLVNGSGPNALVEAGRGPGEDRARTGRRPGEAGQGRASGNRKWWQQTGSRQSTPLWTLRTRYGNSVLTPEATRICKTQQNYLQNGSRYGIPVSTAHRRYGHGCGRRFCGRHVRDF